MTEETHITLSYTCELMPTSQPLRLFEIVEKQAILIFLMGDMRYVYEVKRPPQARIE
jgi:hypothetical protein